jgi:hypothetical protein
LELTAHGGGTDGAFFGQLFCAVSFHHVALQDVRAMIPELMCLKINQSGEPAHPLYQPGLAHPMPWIS